MYTYVHLHTRFHTPTVNGSSVYAIKPRGKKNPPPPKGAFGPLKPTWRTCPRVRYYYNKYNSDKYWVIILPDNYRLLLPVGSNITLTWSTMPTAHTRGRREARIGRTIAVKIRWATELGKLQVAWQFIRNVKIHKLVQNLYRKRQCHNLRNKTFFPQKRKTR